MGASLNIGGKRGGRRRRKAISEINVTPFVDVMLVLLIIFMVTAPLITAGVKVDLPKSSSSPITDQEEPLVISVTKGGDVYIQDIKIDDNELIARLSAITKSKKNSRISVKGDKSVSYGVVMRVMSRINAAGYSKVSLLTEIE